VVERGCRKAFAASESTLSPPTMDVQEMASLGLGTRRPSASSDTVAAVANEYGLTHMLLEVYAQLYKHWVPETTLTLADRVDTVVRKSSSQGSSGRQTPPFASASKSGTASGEFGAPLGTLSSVCL
jgi:hypothetical protein